MHRHASQIAYVHCGKPVRDLRHTQVIAQRYCCLKCHHILRPRSARRSRVYPRGVSHERLAASLKALWVLLHILGISYQGMTDLLESLLHPVSKTAVYRNVQAAGKKVRQLRRARRKQHAGKIQAFGIDFTHAECNGRDRIVAVASAILTGEPINIELLDAEASVRVLQ